MLNTGGTPNLVYLVTHTEETHWTEVLDQVKVGTHQMCCWTNNSIINEISGRDQLIEKVPCHGNQTPR